MRRIAAALLAALITLLMAACGTSGTSDTNSKGGPGASSADLKYVKSQIDKYMAVPTFTPPGGPIDASKLAGKHIFTIPTSSTVPFCNDVLDAMKPLAEKVGLKHTVWKNQGQPDQWVQGFNAAMSQGADLINAFCGLPADQVAPQIQQAANHNIPVVSSHTYAVGQKPLSSLAGVFYGAYTKAAKLMADWIIHDTDGKANVLVVTSPSTSNAPAMEQAIRDEFNKYCQECKATYFPVVVADWPKSIDPKVRAELTSNPDLNYVLALYDGMVQFIVPAITATGKTGDVKIATFNATPSVLDQIREGDVVAFEVGEDLNALAAGILDEDMRVLLGQKVSGTPQAPVRIFTDENVKDAGVPAELGKGYGNAAIKGYLDLWGF